MNFCMAAFLTNADVTAQAPRFAFCDGRCRFFLDIRLATAVLAESIVGAQEDFLDREAWRVLFVWAYRDSQFVLKYLISQDIHLRFDPEDSRPYCRKPVPDGCKW